jgi:hypothetical protein
MSVAPVCNNPALVDSTASASLADATSDDIDPCGDSQVWYSVNDPRNGWFNELLGYDDAWAYLTGVATASWNNDSQPAYYGSYNWEIKPLSTSDDFSRNVYSHYGYVTAEVYAWYITTEDVYCTASSVPLTFYIDQG